MIPLVIAGLVLILIAGAIHVYIFVLEALAFPTLGAKTFGVPPQDLAATRPWALNQGWYNLFLAVGAIAGSIVGLAAVGAASIVGVSIAMFVGATMLGASIVLVVSQPKQLRGALVQGLLPLLGLLALTLGLTL